MHGLSRCWNITLITLILTANPHAASSQSASSDHVPSPKLIPYAPIKRPIHPTEDVKSQSFLLPLPFPKTGVLIAYGSFLNSGADWTIVDFSEQTIQRVRTVTKSHPDGSRYGFIVFKSGRRLTPTETNEIIREANMVWNPAPIPPPPPQMVTDVSCDVLLFDQDDVLHDQGPTCPDEGLVHVIEVLKTETINSP